MIFGFVWSRMGVVWVVEVFEEVAGSGVLVVSIEIRFLFIRGFSFWWRTNFCRIFSRRSFVFCIRARV